MKQNLIAIIIIAPDLKLIYLVLVELFLLFIFANFDY